MLNIIYSEILKLKKSNFMVMSLISALGMVMFMDAVILILQDKRRTFKNYSFNIGLLNSFIVFSMIFCMIACYVFIREHTDKTASTLYSYPFSRIKVFFGKLFVIYMMIALIYLIQCISMYLSYYEIYGILEKDQIMLNIKVNFYSMLFQMSCIPIIIFIGNIKNNIIIPIGYQILTLIINGMRDNKYISQIEYNPFVGASSVFRYFYADENLEIRSMAIASIVFFLVSISICIYHFHKVDIQ